MFTNLNNNVAKSAYVSIQFKKNMLLRHAGDENIINKGYGG